MTDTKIDHHCTYLFVQKGRALYNLLISFTFNAILVILLVSCFSSDTEIALVYAFLDIVSKYHAFVSQVSPSFVPLLVLFSFEVVCQQ